MELPVASLDPTLATLILSTLVLIAGVVLAAMALNSKNGDQAKQVFAVVGVLFGLLAAGGLGTLFANQAAETAADSAADKAASVATEEVSGEVSDQVEKALEAPPASSKK